MLQRENHLENRLGSFVKGEVKDEEDALKGARDIIAEQVSEDERARNQLRNQFLRQAVITSKVIKGKEEEAVKYRDYFDFSEPLKRCTSHRLLAIRRGESEGLLKVTISPDDNECSERLERMYVRSNNECGHQVAEAVRDAYKRLLKPSIETEFATLSKEKADTEAIRVFAENLRQLLLAPPLGQKRVLGIDPGFRTGCKLVCLDAQGNLLHNEAIYPHPPKNENSIAGRKVAKLVEIGKLYDIREALELVQKTKTAKFNETVEVALRLGVDPRHADQQIRGTVVLPHGTGKSVKILAITSGENVEKALAAGADYAGAEEYISQIQQGWLDFDLVIATPDMMPKIGRLGKILGTKGLMPNPKSGTVTPDIAAAVSEFKKGKLAFRIDKLGSIHAPIGKADFDLDKIEENFRTFMDQIIRLKPASSKGQYLKTVAVSLTMGPGVKMDPAIVGKIVG